MADDELRRLVLRGIAQFRYDAHRIEKVDRYERGEHDDPYMPTTATAEYQRLAKRAITNFLPLVVSTPAQAMRVSDYGHAGADSNEVAPEWRAWQENRMDSRQHAVHRAAVMYGVAYVTVLPENGKPVVRGVSPRCMYAEYDDPANDALPIWALQVERLPDEYNPRDVVRSWLITQTHVYEYQLFGGEQSVMEETGSYAHGIRLDGKPVCPVVRFAPDIDLEGRVRGAVWPLIPIQDKVNQTVFDLLIAQTFGSFKIRTVTGMAPELERDENGEVVYENGKPKPLPIKIPSSSRFLVAPDPTTTFGSLPETPLGGFLDSIEAGVKQISVLSQTPPHYLLGSVVNLSAEALAAAESALTRAVRLYQASCGESWELALALVGAALGREWDREAQVVWADHESRSLAQTIDALGKAAQMLQVPPRELWSKIPGATGGDIERWNAAYEADDEVRRQNERMISAFARPSEPREVPDAGRPNAI